MEVRLEYNQEQVDRAVEFISANNKSFFDQSVTIRGAIMAAMHRIAKEPGSQASGSMGFLLIADWEMEGLEHDENVVRIEIWVDPALNEDTYTHREERITWKPTNF
jgi:hypothetical protein